MGGRLGQPQHCSACRMYSNTLRRPRTTHRPSAFDFRRCGSFILHAHRDYPRHTQERLVLISSISTFCNCVLNQMPLACSGPTARLLMIVLAHRHWVHPTPDYSAMRPCSASHRRAVPRPKNTSCHHSSSMKDHPCHSNAWTCLPFSCGDGC